MTLGLVGLAGMVGCVVVAMVVGLNPLLLTAILTLGIGGLVSLATA
jgi:hypothetical protein